VRCLDVRGGQEIDGGACFYQEQDFGWFCDGGEVGDGLLDVVVEEVEVFAAEILDEIALGIGDDYADVDAVNGDLDRGGLGLGGLLRLGEG